MILGVKAFTPQLTAVKGKGEYQFKPGKNVTEKAKCANTGFHLCEDPLDCLTYYDWDGKNQFWAVAAGGDIDEDCFGTRISCTELTLIRRLTADEFLLLHANYTMTHPAEQSARSAAITTTSSMIWKMPNRSLQNGSWSSSGA